MYFKIPKIIFTEEKVTDLQVCIDPNWKLIQTFSSTEIHITLFVNHRNPAVLHFHALSCGSSKAGYWETGSTPEVITEILTTCMKMLLDEFKIEALGQAHLAAAIGGGGYVKSWQN